jgi:hypothetical protein
MMLENAWYEQDVLSHSEMAKCLNAALKDVPQPQMNAVTDQQKIIENILLRLNNRLIELKPDCDDSITGFNDAMDIVRDALHDHPIVYSRRTARPEENGPCSVCGDSDGKGFCPTHNPHPTTLTDKEIVYAAAEAFMRHQLTAPSGNMGAAYKVATAGMVTLDAVRESLQEVLRSNHVGINCSQDITDELCARLTAPRKPVERVIVEQSGQSWIVVLDGKWWATLDTEYKAQASAAGLCAELAKEQK